VARSAASRPQSTAPAPPRSPSSHPRRWLSCGCRHRGEPPAHARRALSFGVYSAFVRCCAVVLPFFCVWVVGASVSLCVSPCLVWCQSCVSVVSRRFSVARLTNKLNKQYFNICRFFGPLLTTFFQRRWLYDTLRVRLRVQLRVRLRVSRALHRELCQHTVTSWRTGSARHSASPSPRTSNPRATRSGCERSQAMLCHLLLVPLSSWR